ncbi:ATP-binding cassette domain-containing protein [Bacillus cabrialesii]|uniref:ATP-binding cassette domain-containing protein n=1 Tax=Bacillus cabrialesii TaxID=2487276 RepID=UPI001C040502|nr:ABC transporter ATP-binding protein [Bacillus cabrialesii]MBU2659852.1 ABC transporter ATP-binding protein [Bacillus cabrialesii]
MSYYIELKDVSKKIKNDYVLKDINLSLEKGKIYGFEGINGSGKTMLFRAILGLIKVEGSISINNEVISFDKKYPIPTGILIENPSVIDEFSATKNLRLIAALQENVGIEEIKKTLELVGLNPNDNKKIKKYSLGMKQKLGLAQAFLGKKELIVLDEPTIALDHKSVDHLKTILLEFKNQGKTILIACHDYEFLMSLSDETFEMKQGRLYK